MENKQKMKAMLKQMQSVIALVIIFVVASIICVKDGKNNFLDVRNLMNVLRAVSENGIIAIGMTIILILGDIDLSVGSVVGLISTGCAYLMVKSGLGFVPAVLLSLIIGGLFGLFNGLCITKLKLQAFIVTLASMNIARGLARFWANGIGIPLAYGAGEGMAPPAFEVRSGTGSDFPDTAGDLPHCSDQNHLRTSDLCHRRKPSGGLSVRY